MDDKEKLEEAIRQINDLLPELSETKEKWLDESVNHEAFNSFLDAVISNLENMKKTLES